MPTRRWDDEDELEDDGDASWDEDDDGTVPCPYCGAAMLEDSPRCPECGAYKSAEDAPPPRKPAWIIAGAVICLIIATWWALGW